MADRDIQGPDNSNLYGVATGSHVTQERPDEDIKRDILRGFHNLDEVDSSLVEVSVFGGEAHLSGTVTSDHARELLGDIAINIQGVHDVNNEIRVRPNS